MGAATHPITDAIWREALAPELALTVNGRTGIGYRPVAEGAIRADREAAPGGLH